MLCALIYIIYYIDQWLCVGSSFLHFRRAFTTFENKTPNQFYNRNARTLTAAAKLTPKIAEKANKDLKYW